MADRSLAPLPKGRHNLTRQQVSDTQRIRLAIGMAEALAERGYASTPVADILKRAGVSRQTFYELYDDKLSCFLDALDFVGEVLLADLAGSIENPTEAIEHFAGHDLARAAVEQYLTTIAEHAAFARLFLVEVFAAGPEAMVRRAQLQARVVDALCGLLGVRTTAGRFAGEAFVAAVSSLVTVPVVTGDRTALLALRDPLVGLLGTIADG